MIMEMTVNSWTSARGRGDWRAMVLARAPQIVTFGVALAIAAQLALIVVGFSSRSRQTTLAVAVAPPAPPLDIGGLVNAPPFGKVVGNKTKRERGKPPPP